MDKFTEPDAQIYLRELLFTDVIEEYLDWFSDLDTNRFMEVKSLTREDAENYILDGKRQGIHYMYAIVDKATDRHIGNVKVGPMDPERLVSDLPTVIGDRSFMGRGIGAEAIRIGQQIAFDVYGVQKMSGGIYHPNFASLKAYARAGWIEVGRRKAVKEIDGNWVDEILVENYNPKYFIVDESGVRPRSTDS